MKGQGREEGPWGGGGDKVRGVRKGNIVNKMRKGGEMRIPEKRKKGRGVGGVRRGTIRAQREAKTS